MITRRRLLANITKASAALTLCPHRMKAAWLPSTGTYQNPILGGDHPDASPIRVGQDFYLTHSSFDYAPGLLIWHSKDLVNWRPVAAALHKYYGSVWAPYLCEYKAHFYIYFPAANQIFVTHAAHPEGPWSEPVGLGIHAIDPAHIAENGRRFLYTNGGQSYELSEDGLAVKSGPHHSFDPWPVPASTRMECTCLEGPKLMEHDGYFYLNVAEGGTGGPATSHSVVSMRSRHAEGPWEFSPYNPILHTQSREERWQSLGHGRLVDTADGKWYMTAHSYERDYRTLGRQLLLLPVEWTSDGWYRVRPEIAADSAIPLPLSGSQQRPFDDPSDDFTAASLGLQWGFWHEYDQDRFETGKGYLRLKARGRSFEESPVLSTPVGGHAYTVEVDVELEGDCTAGIFLYYDPTHATGLIAGPGELGIRIGNGLVFSHPEQKGRRYKLRIVNDRNEIDFYFKAEGREWVRTEESAEIAGMNHNVIGGFLDVRPALAAWGSGCATFRNFRYWPEVKTV